VNEIENLSNQVYNLKLYLTDLKEHRISPDDWAELEKKFDGLPGFTCVSIEGSECYGD